MRFNSDQRFKIVTVYLLTTGFLLNVAKDHQSMVLALFGVGLSYLCFSWELGTTRWWGTLITRAQEIEDASSVDGIEISTYRRYRTQIPRTSLNKLPYVRPTLATAGIYTLGLIGWILFFIFSWGTLWSDGSK